MRQKFIFLSAALGIALIFGSLAWSQGYNRGMNGDRNRQGVCRADIEKYCAQSRGDRDAMRKCIKQNMNQFSEQCKAMIQDRVNRAQ